MHFSVSIARIGVRSLPRVPVITVWTTDLHLCGRKIHGKIRVLLLCVVAYLCLRILNVVA